MRYILILFSIGLPVCSWPVEAAVKVDPALYGAPEGQVCIKCHELKTPALFKLWRSGKMGQAGVNCYDCHRAEKKTASSEGDPDGYEHRSFWIATVVSPKDCSKCHKEQFEQQQPSHHAKGADILSSSDNYLGTVVGGEQPPHRAAASATAPISRCCPMESWIPPPGPTRASGA